MPSQTNDTHLAMRPASLRIANAALVLERLADGAPASRAELAERTSLSSQALGAILADLVGDGLVEEQLRATTSPGRPPTEYRLHPTGTFTVSVMVRQADFFVLVDDARHQRMATIRQRYRPQHEAATLVSAICVVVGEIVDDLELDLARLTRVEFATQGTIGERSRVIGSTPAWGEHDIDIADALEIALGRHIEVTATSIERAHAAHALLRVPHRPNELIAIVHIGFESRLLLAKGDELIGNRLGDGGLLSHLPVVGVDRVCECGATGCLGTVSGGGAVVAYYRELGNTPVSTAAEVIDLVGHGDVEAIEAARRSIDWLARGVAPILDLLQPDRIICTGGGVGRPESPGAIQMISALRARLGPRLADRPICVVAPPFVTDDRRSALSPPT